MTKGVQELKQGIIPPEKLPASEEGAKEDAKEKAFEFQHRWLQIVMAADLQMRPIDVVPCIDPEWLSFGFQKDAMSMRLLPNDIWKLRGIGPVARYAVYTHTMWLANNMARHYLRRR
jgi:hypothetical protein